MQKTKRMVTKEEVDKEIMRLKKKRNNGEGLEDTDLYNLKIKGLETVKNYVKEKEEWTRLQEA